MENIYGQCFYKNRHQYTTYSAQSILDIVLNDLPEINSAADFGCGVGSWLSILKEKNIHITGLDGSWVPTEELKIPEKNFIKVDFSKELKNCNSFIWNLQKFDLSISLEVAEHIPLNLADSFISLLTSHSKFILFSAAIPNQGGTNHINEQYPSYWINKFNKNGFKCIDPIRYLIWNDPKIPFYYRQNIFLAYEHKLEKFLKCPIKNHPLDIIHPDQAALFHKRNDITLRKAISYILRRILYKK